VPADLQSALKLASCCKRDDAKGRSIKVLPCGAPWVIPNPFARAASDPLRQNTTCVVVQVVPGLEAGQVVTLQLPQGAQYNPVAGRARQKSEVYLWGLRRFRIPLRDNFQQLTGPDDVMGNDDNGITYRRMTMWLPHGLAPSVGPKDLERQISLCRYADPYQWSSPCNSVKFYLERINKGKLMMRVPTINPREHFRIQVKGNWTIKDAFGLPLEPSEAFFFTTDPNPGLSGPQLSNGGTLMVLEPSPSNAPLAWPIASRGKPRWESDPAGALAWPVTASSYPGTLNVTTNFDDNIDSMKIMGAPSE